MRCRRGPAALLESGYPLGHHLAFRSFRTSAHGAAPRSRHLDIAGQLTRPDAERWHLQRRGDRQRANYLAPDGFNIAISNFGSNREAVARRPPRSKSPTETRGGLRAPAVVAAMASGCRGPAMQAVPSRKCGWQRRVSCPKPRWQPKRKIGRRCEVPDRLREFFLFPLTSASLQPILQAFVSSSSVMAATRI